MIVDDFEGIAQAKAKIKEDDLWNQFLAVVQLWRTHQALFGDEWTEDTPSFDEFAKDFYEGKYDEQIKARRRKFLNSYPGGPEAFFEKYPEQRGMEY